VLLAGAVVATQLDGGAVATASPGVQSVRATPFEVAPQDIAFVNFTAQGVSVYQTRVTEACPVVAIDCTTATIDPNPVLRLKGGNAGSRGLAVNSRKGQLAVVAANDSGSDSISVIRLPAYRRPNTPLSSPTTRPSSGSSGSSPATDPPSRPEGSSTPSGGETTSSEPPEPSGKPGRTATPDATASPTPDAESPGPTSPTDAPRTQRPGRSPKPQATPGSPDPTPDASEDVSTTPGTEPGTKGVTPDPSLSSPAAVEVALSIAEDVRLAGAAPAWSAEGDMLAFSAMPADLGEGPDVYLWRVGDEKASRLTTDHRSYFASWVDGRVVMSRIVPSDAADADADPDASTVAAPVAQTVVVDIASREERIAKGPAVWLPAVDPAARVAVAWVGRLRREGRSVAPAAGGLYLVRWSLIDPFAPQPDPEPPNGPGQSGPPATGEPERSASPDGTAAPDGIAEPRTSPVPSEPTSTRTPRVRKPRSSAVPGQEPPASSEPNRGPLESASPESTSPEPAASGTAAPEAILQPVEPQRDEAADPVLDWVIRWSGDSTTVGYWIADAPRSNWGRLSIRQITLQDGEFALESVLGPNLARRAFSMGSDRVAWVAPSEVSTEGELRVRTWDAHGFGDLRIHTLDSGGGVPAF
jgi:hypothetical protein